MKWILIYLEHGLLTTVGYKFGNEKPVYALEGSVAIAGACMNWLVDNLQILDNTKDSGFFFLFFILLNKFSFKSIINVVF